MRRASFNARPRVLSRVASLAIIGTLRSDNRDGNGNVNKAIGLMTKTTSLHVHHASLYVSLTSLHDYGMKMPNFTFFRGSNTSDDEISSLFLNLDMVLRDSFLGGLTYILLS